MQIKNTNMNQLPIYKNTKALMEINHRLFGVFRDVLARTSFSKTRRGQTKLYQKTWF
jgi:hypothetical protein